MTMKSVLSLSEQRLKEAIESCRIYQTRQLLETGTPAEFVDVEGLSPLLRAIRLDDEKHRTRSSLIKLLLQFGADVNTRDPEGRHALAFACRTQKQELVRLLLATSIHDIDLNQKDNEGNTPLMHAVRVGNVEIVRIIVDSLNRFQINMDVRNAEDRTPYLEAKRLGLEECAGILLNEGHASTNIQVNPFLEFIENNDEKPSKGEVYSTTLHASRNSSPARCTQNNRKSKQQRLLKRKASSPKGLRRKKQENLDSIQEEMQYNLQDSGFELRNTKVTSAELIIQEAEAANVEAELLVTMVTPTPRPLSARPGTATLISVSELPVRATHARNTKSHGVSGKTFLTTGEETEVLPLVRNSRTRHQRAKTAPNRTSEERQRSNARGPMSCVLSDIRSSVQYPVRSHGQASQCFVDDMSSWYSHFSINTSPSVAFIHKIMSLYAEQLCPESSYRAGYKFVASQQPSREYPTSDSEPDKMSIDGLNSSIGSLHSGQGGRIRKISTITRSVSSVSPFLPTGSRKLGSSAGSKNRS